MCSLTEVVKAVSQLSGPRLCQLQCPRHWNQETCFSFLPDGGTECAAKIQVSLCLYGFSRVGLDQLVSRELFYSLNNRVTWVTKTTVVCITHLSRSLAKNISNQVLCLTLIVSTSLADGMYGCDKFSDVFLRCRTNTAVSISR